MTKTETIHLEHTGWLEFPAGDLVASYIREGWFEFVERAFLFAFLRPGNCYIDVGAHAGFHAATARNIVGKNGRVICLEPNPAMHPYLKQNVRGAELYELAISDHSGESVFDPGALESSSFAHLVERADPDIQTLRVKTSSLPDFLHSANITAPDFIKVDIEGAEQALINGASDFLKAYSGVLLIEFSKENLSAFGHTTQSLETSITQCGLQLCSYDPLANELRPAQIEHPIWYENFFLCHEIEAVNRRLAEVTPSRWKVVTDIITKGQFAKTTYTQSDILSKEREKMRDLAENIKGLNAYLRTEGRNDLETIKFNVDDSDPVKDLQSEYGVIKEISTHHLAELRKRETALLELSNLAYDLSNLANRLLNVLEINQTQHKQPLDSSEMNSPTAALVKDSLNDLQLIEAKTGTLISFKATTDQAIAAFERALHTHEQERTDRQAEVRQISQRLVEKDREIELLNQEISEKNPLIWDQGAKIQKQNVAIEKHESELRARAEELNLLRHTIEEKEHARLEMQAEIQKHNFAVEKHKSELSAQAEELNLLRHTIEEKEHARLEMQTELQQRNAHYAGLISAAINYLYELRRSRALRIALMLGPKADQKIKDTIHTLSS